MSVDELSEMMPWLDMLESTESHCRKLHEVCAEAESFLSRLPEGAGGEEGRAVLHKLRAVLLEDRAPRRNDRTLNGANLRRQYHL